MRDFIIHDNYRNDDEKSLYVQWKILSSFLILSVAVFFNPSPLNRCQWSYSLFLRMEQEQNGLTAQLSRVNWWVLCCMPLCCGNCQEILGCSRPEKTPYSCKSIVVVILMLFFSMIITYSQTSNILSEILIVISPRNDHSCKYWRLLNSWRIYLDIFQGRLLNQHVLKTVRTFPLKYRHPNYPRWADSVPNEAEACAQIVHFCEWTHVPDLKMEITPCGTRVIFPRSLQGCPSISCGHPSRVAYII